MNPIGRLAQVWLPEVARRRALLVLFRRTGAAFDRRLPAVAGLSADEILHWFGVYTARWSTECHANADVRQRLFEVGYGFGVWLRRVCGVSSPRDVMAAARVMYRMLDIDLLGTPDGQVTIPRCAFSAVYAPRDCRVMSALDAGALAGLSRGGRLTFSQRLTDGAPCCVAQLEMVG